MQLNRGNLRNEDIQWVCPLCKVAHPWSEMVAINDGKSLLEGQPHRALIDKGCFEELKKQDEANGETGRHFADHECTPHQGAK